MGSQEVGTVAVPEIGSRVVVDGHRATVRYIGPVGKFAGEWLGVDWDDPTRGKHDGSHENKQYFVATSAHSGSFVRPQRVDFGHGILKALQERYASEMDEVSFPQQQIGSKTIEFVRMDKTQHQQQDFSLLRVVVLDEMPVSRVFDNSESDINLRSCMELNIRSTLFFRWSDLFYLVSHLPRLHILNLSKNIMQPLMQATQVDGASRVTTLILSECRLDWQQFELLGQIFPSMAEVVLSFNRITSMTEPCSTSFQQLTKLDLEGNNINDFNFVRCLSKLPKLKYLNANNLGIPSVQFTDGDATALEQLAVERGHPFVRFDYTDLGQSVSDDGHKTYSFEQWRLDVLTVLDELTDGPQILVGSSMGGWLALLTALERPDRIAGIVTISVSCGFFSRYASGLSAEQRLRLNKGETVMVKNGDLLAPINSRMLTESAPFDLLHRTSIPITCPLRCIHSLVDDVAPYQNMLKLVEKIESPDVEIVMRRAADHRMNDDASQTMSSGQAVRLSRELLPPLGYVKRDGAKLPGIVYIGGFMSNMTGVKAIALEQLAVERGHSFIRFDYTDLGQSVSDDGKKTYSFEQWRQDVLTVLDELTDGPQILVGSSMGGWLSLLTALERPDRIAGIVTISVSCGFFPRFASGLSADVCESQRVRLNKGETVMVNSEDRQMPINSRMLTESAPFDLLHHTSIPITCPLRCIHSLADDVAPYQNMLKLVEKIKSPDVEIVMRRAADYRMNDSASQAVIGHTIDQMLKVCST
uniref:Palmitoyl-protein thioesterase ABHD10, mitochondrial n=2 Tax=Plectus sambesii TaxID=2011161 RepID=A0A914VY32_9BILA